jgi:hypothetical protein
MAVPWTQIIRWAPQIIVLSRELLQRVRRETDLAPAASMSTGEPRPDLARRIIALEENERRQAELVQKMAEQQAELARAVVTLHQRERWLIGACVVLLGLVIWALLR